VIGDSLRDKLRKGKT
jgi:hypothetical protein